MISQPRSNGAIFFVADWSKIGKWSFSSLFRFLNHQFLTWAGIEFASCYWLLWGFLGVSVTLFLVYMECEVVGIGEGERARRDEP